MHTYIYIYLMSNKRYDDYIIPVHITIVVK